MWSSIPAPVRKLSWKKCVGRHRPLPRGLHRSGPRRSQPCPACQFPLISIEVQETERETPLNSRRTLNDHQQRRVFCVLYIYLMLSTPTESTEHLPKAESFSLRALTSSRPQYMDFHASFPLPSVSRIMRTRNQPELKARIMLTYWATVCVGTDRSCTEQRGGSSTRIRHHVNPSTQQQRDNATDFGQGCSGCEYT